MIGLVIGCALCLSLGWYARRWWEKEEALRREDEAARLSRLEGERYGQSPYTAAIREFDRRIKFARDHHMSVKHILDERQNFVTDQLRSDQINLEQMQCTVPDYGGLQNSAYSIPYFSETSSFWRSL